MLSTPPTTPQPTLELTSLPTRHPGGKAFLENYSSHVIVRLSVAPTPLPSGTICREIEVDWLPRRGSDAQRIRRSIGWEGNTYCTPEGCAEMPDLVPATEITATAAVGIFALLISDLEQGQVCTLAPLGSGADYWVDIEGVNQPILAEVSGIRSGNQTAFAKRVAEKTDQLFTKDDTRVGFVSVTNFLTTDTTVHSCLTYANRRKLNREKRLSPNRPRKR